MDSRYSFFAIFVSITNLYIPNIIEAVDTMFYFLIAVLMSNRSCGKKTCWQGTTAGNCECLPHQCTAIRSEFNYLQLARDIHNQVKLPFVKLIRGSIQKRLVGFGVRAQGLV